MNSSWSQKRTFLSSEYKFITHHLLLSLKNLRVAFRRCSSRRTCKVDFEINHFDSSKMLLLERLNWNRANQDTSVSTWFSNSRCWSFTLNLFSNLAIFLSLRCLKFSKSFSAWSLSSDIWNDSQNILLFSWNICKSLIDRLFIMTRKHSSWLLSARFFFLQVLHAYAV